MFFWQIYRLTTYYVDIDLETTNKLTANISVSMYLFCFIHLSIVLVHELTHWSVVARNIVEQHTT